jgi:hypothetical protein
MNLRQNRILLILLLIGILFSIFCLCLFGISAFSFSLFADLDELVVPEPSPTGAVVRETSTPEYTDTPQEPTDSPSPTVSPSSTIGLPTPSVEPTSTIEPTETIEPTFTNTPEPTVTPTPTVEPLLKVMDILGKPVSEVEAILGQTVLVTPNDDSDDKLAGGEYRDYQLGEYTVFVAYDRSGISRLFQVMNGLSEKDYSLEDWEEILPVFGLDISVSPDRKAPAAFYWDDYDGLSIAVIASSANGKPVWSVRVAQLGYP